MPNANSQGLITDLGDVDIWPADIKQTFDNTTKMTQQALAGCDLLVVMGGDHAITYPVVRAVTGFHGRARNLEPVRFSIPIRRVRISLVPHPFVRKKINAFIVIFKLMRAQCEPQRDL